MFVRLKDVLKSSKVGCQQDDIFCTNNIICVDTMDDVKKDEEQRLQSHLFFS